jgi:hypothetical protein
MTPYKAAKFVNDQLKEAGVDKVIPPQMMYNYTKARVNKGKKPLIKFDEKAGVDQKDLERWTKTYIEKLQSKVETTNA